MRFTATIPISCMKRARFNWPAAAPRLGGESTIEAGVLTDPWTEMVYQKVERPATMKAPWICRS